MLKYRQPKLIRVGIIGVVLCLLIIAVGLAPERLISLATAAQYRALFADAAGLTTGNDVRISGVKVGTVTKVSLQGLDALVSFTVERRLPLGSETTAHITTGTLLGQRVLKIEPAGRGVMDTQQVIPMTRTSSPYSLTQAVDELTTNTAGTDTDALNRALDTLATTIDNVAPQLKPTFEGLTRLSQTINERDRALDDLLTSASDVTGVLAQRTDQVNTLILDANELLGVLVSRREAIVQLLANTSAVAQQLTGLVHDNREKLGPALDKLNSVLRMLEANRDAIDVALPRLSRYMITLGETVSSGHYYMAFVPNLALGALTQPFFDYAFGLRRGTDAGQPPDNAGPRAELPLPRNGIPQAPR